MMTQEQQQEMITKQRHVGLQQFIYDLKYRKKPVVIEAFQMTRERRFNNSEWPEWLHRAWNFERGDVGSLFPTRVTATSDESDTLSIGTLEGQQLVSWNDWIIQGVKGEIYPCADDIFQMTYEQA